MCVCMQLRVCILFTIIVMHVCTRDYYLSNEYGYSLCMHLCILQIVYCRIFSCMFEDYVYICVCIVLFV